MNNTIKLLFLILLFWSCGQKKEVQTPPNIILIVTDDQRWDAIGYAGNEIIITPEQDQLAKEGTYFNKAFVTTPICGASRATIITGLYERKHKFSLGGTTLDSIYNRKNYARELQKKGYKTGFFGKLGIKNNGNLADSFSEHEVYDRNNKFKDHRGYYYKTIGKTPYTSPDTPDTKPSILSKTQIVTNPFVCLLVLVHPMPTTVLGREFRNNIFGSRK